MNPRLWMLSISIFVFSCALRIPASQESYWIDELHSAWSIAGTLSDVADRAAQGHQQPIYFQFLWFWKQFFGDGEVAMRMVSVLATSLGCSVLFVSVSRFHGSLSAGFAAGTLLATETMSVIFGTELRPYAIVMLASVFVCFFTSVLWIQPPDVGRSSRAWVGLWIAIAISALCQITSMGVFLWIPVVLVTRHALKDSKATLKFYRTDLWAIGLMVCVGLSLMSSGVVQTWNERSLWASFASAKSISQIAELWPWLPLLLAPLFVLVAGVLMGRIQTRQASLQGIEKLTILVVWLGIVLLSTIFFWWIAYTGIAAVWHRRYLIASLPIIAWFFGAAIGEGIDRLRPFLSSRITGLATFLVSFLLIGFIMFEQGTARRLVRGEWPIARREDWRGAIELVNRSTKPGGVVWIDPDLIEQKAMQPSEVLLENGGYLRFAVDGPYSIRSDLSVLVVKNLARVEDIGNLPDVILSRHGCYPLENRIGSNFNLHCFGGVTVGIPIEAMLSNRASFE